jgi:hypothetical protein
MASVIEANVSDAVLSDEELRNINTPWNSPSTTNSPLQPGDRRH